MPVPIAAIRGKNYPQSIIGVDWWLSGGITAANCLAAYKATGAANLAATYTNLANPGTYTITDAAPSRPAWATNTGWQFQAVNSQMLTTNISTTPNGAWSLIIRFSNYVSNSALAQTFIGSYTDANTAMMLATGGPADSKLVAYNGKGYPTGLFEQIPHITSGVYAIAGKGVFRDGIKDVNAIPSGAGSASLGILIGSSGIINQYLNAYVQCCAIYNVTLTDAQVLAVSQAMAAL